MIQCIYTLLTALRPHFQNCPNLYDFLSVYEKSLVVRWLIYKYYQRYLLVYIDTIPAHKGLMRAEGPKYIPIFLEGH